MIKNEFYIIRYYIEINKKLQKNSQFINNINFIFYAFSRDDTSIEILKELLCILLSKDNNALFKEEYFSVFLNFFLEKEYLHKNMYPNIKKFLQFLRCRCFENNVFKILKNLMYFHHIFWYLTYNMTYMASTITSRDVEKIYC